MNRLRMFVHAGIFGIVMPSRDGRPLLTLVSQSMNADLDRHNPSTNILLVQIMRAEYLYT